MIRVMAAKPSAFPDKVRLDGLLLKWLLRHLGLQRRRDLVVGAAQLQNFSPAIRGLPAHRQDQQYPDLLHERLNYRVWALRDAGLVENPVRARYRLTRRGRAQATRLRRTTSRPRTSANLERATRHARGDKSQRDDHPLGCRYTPVELMPTSRAPAPFTWDPDERDRQTQAHQQLVHALAEAIERLGFEPRLPRQDEIPLYDLAYGMTSCGAHRRRAPAPAA